MSLSLSIYLASARRHGTRLLRQAQEQTLRPTRPRGELVWIHLDSAKDMHKIQPLIHKLRVERGDLTFVLTFHSNAPDPASLEDAKNSIIVQNAPPETPQHSSAFIEHWVPDVAIWLTSTLRPALILETSARNIPMLMLGVERPAILQPKKRGDTSIIKNLLARFQVVIATTEQTQTDLIRQGVNTETILACVPLGYDTVLPPCTDAMRDRIAETLKARPVWLAHKITPSEVDPVIAAHRSAMRRAHRLLLVVIPDNPQNGRDFAHKLYDQGWQVALRSGGDHAQEDTQILIADIPDELGLWMRIAPVCFLGNTLTDTAYGAAPFDALSLGSSILFGPRTGEFKDIFAKLVKVGAARRVDDQAVLSAVVAELLAPDKAAKMAHQGWEISSQSAQTTDHIAGVLHEILDGV